MNITEVVKNLNEVVIPALEKTGDNSAIESAKAALRTLTMPTVSKFVVFSSSGLWGKGATLVEARKNALLRAKDRAIAYATSDDVTIYESGRITASMLIDLGVIKEANK